MVYCLHKRSSGPLFLQGNTSNILTNYYVLVRTSAGGQTNSRYADKLNLPDPVHCTEQYFVYSSLDWWGKKHDSTDPDGLLPIRI